MTQSRHPFLQFFCCISRRNNQQFIILSASRHPRHRINLEQLSCPLQTWMGRKLVLEEKSSQAACPADMTQIRAKAIGEIHHRVHQTTGRQALSQINPGTGIKMGAAEFGKLGVASIPVPAQGKSGRSAAKGAGNKDHIPFPGPGPVQNLPLFHLANYSQPHTDPAGTGDRIPTDQSTAIFVTGADHSFTELTCPLIIKISGQTQGKKEIARLAAHGRDVTDIDGNGFSAQEKRRMPGKIKMDLFNKGVGAVEKNMPVIFSDHGTVIAHGQKQVVICSGRGQMDDTFDQFTLVHGPIISTS